MLNSVCLLVTGDWSTRRRPMVDVAIKQCDSIQFIPNFGYAPPHNAQNKLHFSEDDVLQLSCPCGSFEPSFVRFSRLFFSFFFFKHIKHTAFNHTTYLDFVLFYFSISPLMHLVVSFRILDMHLHRGSKSTTIFGR